MITKISSKIVSYLTKSMYISDGDQELYQYGFFIMMSQILYFIVTLFLGALFGILIESVIFYIAFSLIRRYAGGYHAATETNCEIMSALSILFCISAIKLVHQYDFQLPLLLIAMISAVIIFVLCPLDTPEKPLTEKEFRYFRRISWIISLIISAVAIVSLVFKWNILFAPACVGLILESILLIAGKVKRINQLKNATK